MIGMVKDIQAGKEPKVDEGYLNALGSYLKDPSLDKAFVAKALELPGEKYIADQMDVVDVDAVAKARKMVSDAFVKRFEKDLVQTYDALDVEKPFEPVAKDAGERALKTKRWLIWLRRKTGIRRQSGRPVRKSQQYDRPVRRDERRCRHGSG